MVGAVEAGGPHRGGCAARRDRPAVARPRGHSQRAAFGITRRRVLDDLDARRVASTGRRKTGGMPRLKQYPGGHPQGVPLQDVIADIRPMHNL